MPAFQPRVASDRTDYLVVWAEQRNFPNYSIYGARVRRDGVIMDPSGILICTGPSRLTAPTVAGNGGNYLVAWMDGRNGNDDIYGTIITSAGLVLTPNGFPINTNAHSQALPAAAGNGTDFIVVWQHAVDPLLFPGQIPNIEIQGARISGGGTLVDTLPLHISGNQGERAFPAVAASGENYLVVWADYAQRQTSGADILGANVNSAGGVGIPLPMSTRIAIVGGQAQVVPALGDQQFPTVAGNAAGYFVAWDDTRGPGPLVTHDVYGTRVQPDGQVVDVTGVRITQDHRAVAAQPAASATDCNYLVEWETESFGAGTQEIRGTRIANDGAFLDPRGLAINMGPGDQRFTAVAYGGLGQFLSVCENVLTGNHRIEASFLTTPARCGEPIPGLFNTGVDANGTLLADGAFDPHYRLTQSADPAFPGPNAVVNFGWPVGPAGPWLTNGPDSKWIAPQASQAIGHEPGDYTYSIEFDLSGLDPATASIVGQWATDNLGVDVLLNGRSRGVQNSGGFGVWTPFQIAGGFQPGLNTLSFYIRNAGTAVNPTGLRVELEGAASPPGSNSNCLDFRTLPPGIQPNPWTYGRATFFGTNSDGSPLSGLEITSIGGLTGLRYFYGLLIDWTNTPCETIELLLLGSATVTTLDRLGTLLETKTTSGSQQAPETLRFQGRDVVRIVIDRTSNEAWLLQLCCVPVTSDASCRIVTTTADSGTGSLRAAIECANANPGLDTITFAIPGAGPHTIRPVSPLPMITDPVVIDGYSQPGASPNTLAIGNNAQIKVEIDGSLLAVAADGLVIAAENCGARGLAVNRFREGVGIRLLGRSNEVEGCFIGTDVWGTNALPNHDGIWVVSATFNQIGGPHPGARNVISGNRYAGVFVVGATAVGNRIQGNYLGTDASGLNALGNGTPIGNGAGVAISFGAFNLIGGSNPGEGNVISGNYQSNVSIAGNTNTVLGNFVGPDVSGTRGLGSGYYGVIVHTHAVGNVIGGTNAGAGNLISGNPRGINLEADARFTWIAGNKIGTDVTGERPLGNAVDGIHMVHATDTLVGGLLPGSANLIAFNGFRGVQVTHPSVRNAILGNSIHGNRFLGIDLVVQSSPNEVSEGPTPNDRLDPDSGANELQNYPLLIAASTSAGDVRVVGWLQSAPTRMYRIELFANTVLDPSGYGEGERFVGSANLSTDSDGNGTFVAFVPETPGHSFYTATATDIAAGNTSEFSAGVAIAPACLLVTTDADEGPGSLRAAIECANANPGLDAITFAIPGAGPHTIRPLSPLPAITDPVVIDGWTQPGTVPNSSLLGNNGQLMIEIDGSLISSTGKGLVVNAGNSALRGLAINNFNRDRAVGIFLASSSNVVEGCFVGTDTRGSNRRPNSYGVWVANATFNQIGGANASSRNVISGNGQAIYVEGQASIGNRIQGNYVGTDASGLTRLGNGGGVAIAGGAFNLIGGPNPGEGNVISGSRHSNVNLFGDTNIVQGNFVGPDCTGTRSLSSGEGYYGVIIQNGSGNQIGGSSAGAGNLISGNIRGIDVIAPETIIAGNRIGTDISGTRPLGNVVHGIMCYPPFVGLPGSFNSVIGGSHEGSGNIIAFNNADGIKVEGADAPFGVSILGNSIHDNLGLGIDLSRADLSDGSRGDGPTPNDSEDLDDGPNRLQNFPILGSARLVGGNIAIEGTLNSRAGTMCRVEFFANAVADPSGYGEGEVFLGFTNVTTDTAGKGVFLAFLTAVACKPLLTATATDSDGNTSEFSPAIGLISAAAIPCLWNTGVDSGGNPLPDDALDRHYLLVPGSPVQGTPFVARAGRFPIPPWLEDSPSSAWIAPSTDTHASGATDGGAVYRYETSFDLTGFDPSSVVISGRWSTDNGGRDILINGMSTGHANTAQFGAWTPFHIRSGFVAGLNRLTFLVSNGEGEPNPFGPTGLRVEMCGVGTFNARLAIRKQGNQVVVSWQEAGFMLQAADAVTGPWTDFSAGTSVDGINFEVVVQPYVPMKFFRLRSDRACAAAQERLRANSTIPVFEDRPDGIVRFLACRLPWNPAPPLEERALAFLDEYAELFGFPGPAVRFRTNRIARDAVGSHVFLRQYADGIEVLGSEIAVHLTADAITGANGAYVREIPESVGPAIDAAGAIAVAMAGGNRQGAAQIVEPPSLVYFNASIWMSPPELQARGLDAGTHLAWKLRAFQRDGREGLHIVDAVTGAILLRIPLDRDHGAAQDMLIQSAQNTEADWRDCSIDRVVDWFDEAGTIAGAMPPPDQEGQDAFNLFREVYDFYFNTFHRHSWDGNEIQLRAVLDVSNWGRNAAFFPSCNYFVFGEGMVTRDIVAHEFTHGVTEKTAGLEYINQSGALNESYSDVLAAMIDTANWTIGEGSTTGIFRDMQDPPQFTDCNPDPPRDCAVHPDHMDDYRNIVWDFGGVHINSGIPNRAAALIAAGGTHSGITVGGLGRAKAARLYYDVLTCRLTRNSDFMTARNATVQQAKDYVSLNLHSFTHADVCEVVRAFGAVGLMAPDFGEMTPAEFIQLSVVYQRVSDNLQVGTEIIPSTGFSRANIARDRRIILAVTAADNESGVESITYDGELSWECMTPGDEFATRRVATLVGVSDEVRAGTAASGSPIIRTAHFTIDPFEGHPDRLLCARTENQSPVVVTLFINVRNGTGCVTRSGQITFSYLPRPAG